MQLTLKNYFTSENKYYLKLQEEADKAAKELSEMKEYQKLEWLRD